MSVDVSSKLMYGLFYKDAIEGLTEDAIDKINEKLDDGEIEFASPHYDACRGEWFIGFSLGECFGVNDVEMFTQDLCEAHDMFVYRFRKNGQVEARHHVF